MELDLPPFPEEAVGEDGSGGSRVSRAADTAGDCPPPLPPKDFPGAEEALPIAPPQLEQKCFARAGGSGGRGETSTSTTPRSRSPTVPQRTTSQSQSREVSPSFTPQNQTDPKRRPRQHSGGGATEAEAKQPAGRPRSGNHPPKRLAYTLGELARIKKFGWNLEFECKECHVRLRCDVPVFGERFHCYSCQQKFKVSYDLCVKCFENHRHAQEHLWIHFKLGAKMVKHNVGLSSSPAQSKQSSSQKKARPGPSRPHSLDGSEGPSPRPDDIHQSSTASGESSKASLATERSGEPRHPRSQSPEKSGPTGRRRLSSSALRTSLDTTDRHLDARLSQMIRDFEVLTRSPMEAVIANQPKSAPASKSEFGGPSDLSASDSAAVAEVPRRVSKVRHGFIFRRLVFCGSVVLFPSFVLIHSFSPNVLLSWPFS